MTTNTALRGSTPGCFLEYLRETDRIIGTTLAPAALLSTRLGGFPRPLHLAREAADEARYESVPQVHALIAVRHAQAAELLGDKPAFGAAIAKSLARASAARGGALFPREVPPALRVLDRPQFSSETPPVIETAGSGLLVYTPVASRPDTFFERAVGQAPALTHLIRAEQDPGPRQIWTEWLAEGHGLGTFSQLPNGVWRATLRADAFGPSAGLPLTRVGSYELRKRPGLADLRR